MDYKEVATEVAKAAPPVTVTTMTFLGHPLSDWATLLTIIYVVLQGFILLRDKVWRDHESKG